MKAFSKTNISFHNVSEDDFKSIKLTVNRGINDPSIVWVSLDFLGNTTVFYCETWEEAAVALYEKLGGKHSHTCSCPDCEAK